MRSFRRRLVLLWRAGHIKEPSRWGNSLEEAEYDSYGETCENNMEDVDDLILDWADRFR